MNEKSTQLAVTRLVLGMRSVVCLGILAGIPAIGDSAGRSFSWRTPRKENG